MKLIGQYDSPFVRRVAIAMQIYGVSYEHIRWSTFGDAEKLARYNPLKRVPVLVLESGEALIESHAILDYLDEHALPQTPLIARNGEARRFSFYIMGLATGLADKAVTLVYSRLFYKEASKEYIERCESQIADTLNILEQKCTLRSNQWWNGVTLGHDDIAVACTIRFLREAHPHLFTDEAYQALAKHCEKCEALPVFSTVVQPLILPEN